MLARERSKKHSLEERNSLSERLPSFHRRRFWNSVSPSLSLPPILPLAVVLLPSRPLLSSPFSLYLCVRFREIKTTRQVSDAPNLSWQKYALSHAAELPDTTAEVDLSPGFHRSTALRVLDARPDAHVLPRHDSDYYWIFMRLLSRTRTRL
jgi:hypothetical protein